MERYVILAEELAIENPSAIHGVGNEAGRIVRRWVEFPGASWEKLLRAMLRCKGVPTQILGPILKRVVLLLGSAEIEAEEVAAALGEHARKLLNVGRRCPLAVRDLCLLTGRHCRGR